VTAFLTYAPPLAPITPESLKGVRWAAECARLMAARCPDDAMGAIRRGAYKTVAEALFAAADEYERDTLNREVADGGGEAQSTRGRYAD